MNIKQIIKQYVLVVLDIIKADTLFRYLNKKKLLVVQYHSLTKPDNPSPLVTRLDEKTFRKQIEFLNKHYNILSMEQFVYIIDNEKKLPERSALITFDDGYRSNYKIAYPILKEQNTHATIFITVGYIGTQKLLWFDELYLLLIVAIEKAMPLQNILDVFSLNGKFEKFSIDIIYPIISNHLKSYTSSEILNKISELKSVVGLDIYSDIADDLKLLTWEQIKEMHTSSLIHFGVHTYSHCILSHISDELMHEEIIQPKKIIEEKLNCNVKTFCYPNGIPEVDFSYYHEDYLKKSFYSCAFCTGTWLNKSWKNSFRLGRKPAGNDFTSQDQYFRMNTAGVFDLF